MLTYIIPVTFWLVLCAVAFRLDYFTLPQPPLNVRLPQVFIGLAFALFLFIFFVFVPLGLIIHQRVMTGEWMLDGEVDPYFFFWFSFGVYWMLPLSFLGLIFFLLDWYTARSLILPQGKTFKEQLVNDLPLALFTWFLALIPIFLTQYGLTSLAKLLTSGEFAEQVAIKQLKQNKELGSLFIFSIFSVTILIPFFEELVFRGILQTWLRSQWGRWGAIISSSLLFSLAHYSPAQGIANLQILGSLFVLSNFLGFLYERQRSLIAPVLVHSFFNALSVSSIALAF